MKTARLLIAASFIGGGIACAQPESVSVEAAVPTFGTTVVVAGGLEGAVYHIHHLTSFPSAHLPDFQKMKPVGMIYTAALNVPPRDFKEGFPGVTDRFEWFAIDYHGRFWIDKPGLYRFELSSDDGSKLYVDDGLLIDNDGEHPPLTRAGLVTLEGGIHRIRVSYFQGRRYHVALVLRVAGPGEELRVFSTEEFKPPSDPTTWVYPGRVDAGQENRRGIQ